LSVCDQKQINLYINYITGAVMHYKNFFYKAIIMTRNIRTLLVAAANMAAQWWTIKKTLKTKQTIEFEVQRRVFKTVFTGIPDHSSAKTT